ncbi:MAG: glycosyltransferase family 2 protein [Chloroflexi bacterium]|nr:glycosyltransferase family 2 protein [Chloroflexota bacterium]
MSVPDLVIIIVNYNTASELNTCLASLQAAAGTLSMRVVVVDNHSSDDSAEMVRREHPWVSDVIETPHNGGYAYANNIGLRAAGALERGARYFLLLNPDTVLPPNALAEMAALMDANPQVGAAGPRLVRQDGSLDKACRRSFPSPKVSFYHFSGLGKLFPHSKRLACYNLTYLDPAQPAEVDAIVGAFMMMRAEALQQSGLLDEAFFMYGEDIDLCYRIKQQGWRVMYYPQVTVLHIKGAASRKSSLRANLAFYDAMRIFHDKHYRSSTPGLVNLAVDAGIKLLRARALLRERLAPPDKKRVASA